MLLIVLPVAELPEQLLASIVLAVGVVWLESKSLLVGSHYRFSPSAPFILGAACTMTLGPLPAALSVIFAVISIKGVEVVDGLAQRFSFGPAVIGSLLLLEFGNLDFLIRCICVCSLYLVFRLLIDTNSERPATPAERVTWRQLQLRIRPMEVALAAAGIPVAFLLQAEPLVSVLLFPLFRMLHWAAESAVLHSQDKTVAEAFRLLRESKLRERRQAKELSRAKTDKTILENFARQLSSQPTLLGVSQSLVATSEKLTEARNIIVFLSDPPEPVCYRVVESILPTVQAQSLLQLPEPAVTEASKFGKPVIKRKKDQASQTLLSEDPIVSAFPLGSHGVLCLGSETPIPKPVLKQLKWLTEKAALALSAARQRHLEQMEQRSTQNQAAELADQVARLSTLVHGAESFTSSLDPHEIRDRLLQLVRKTFPHSGGLYHQEQGPSHSWGLQVTLPETFRKELGQRDQACIVNDTSRLTTLCQETAASSLIVSMKVQDNQDFLALVSQDVSYTSDQKDQLFILTSQAAMALSNAQLYQQVVRARSELEESQAQLIQSSKMTAIGQLSAGMAHELNSPIGAVSICLEEAKELFKSDPGLAKRLLEKGELAVERAKVILDRMLAYCRQEEFQFKKVDLVELVIDTLDFLSGQLRGIDIRFTEPVQSPLALGDYRALQQVLTNLLTNAQHSLQGVQQPEIQLGITPFSATQEVTIHVADNGCGIEAGHLKRIFEPFFTTKEPGEGTGLGLWATHQIAERHGGRVEVTSEIGLGTKFTVVLPAFKAPQECSDDENHTLPSGKL